MFKKSNLALLFILVIAIILRFWRLDYPDLTPDEGHYAYDAFQYYKGNPGMVPRYHTQYHLEGQIGHPFLGSFLISQAYSVFGLKVFSTRLISAFFGVLTIPFIYLIGRVVFSNTVGLMASAMFTVFPLAVRYDRTVFLDTLLTFLLSVFIFFYLKFKRLRTMGVAMILGMVAGLMALTKFSGLLVLVFIGVDFILAMIKKINYETVKRYLAIGMGFGLIFLAGTAPQAYLTGIFYPTDKNFSQINPGGDMLEMIKTFFSQSFASLIPYLLVIFLVLGLYQALKRKTSSPLPLMLSCWLPLVWIHMTGKSGIYGLLPLMFLGVFFACYYLDSLKGLKKKILLLFSFLWLIYASVGWGVMEIARVKPIDQDALSYLASLDIAEGEKIYLFETPRTYFFFEDRLPFLIDAGLQEKAIAKDEIIYIISTDVTLLGKELNGKLIKSQKFSIEKKFANEERSLIIFKRNRG